MDEKCLFTIVTRENNKITSSLGIELIAQNTHHKSHIHKVMGITVTDLIPLGNDIEKGGELLKYPLSEPGG